MGAFATSWRQRRIAYLFGIGLGCPVLVATWLAEREDDAVLRWAYPLVIATLLAAAVAMVRRPRVVLSIERMTLFAVMVLWLARLAYQALGDRPAEQVWAGLAPWAFMGVTLIVLFAYIVLDTTRAAWAAVLFAVAAGGILMVRFGQAAVTDGDWSRVLALARYQGYLLVTLAFVHLLARSKDAAVHAELEAERMRTMAYRDPLTGLPNRRALVELLDREVDPSRRTPLSLIAFDLDHFKRVNDNLGHPAGDLVLQAAGLSVQQQLRGGDTAGRWGGEEFLVVLPHTTRDQAVDLADRLRRTLERDVQVDGRPVTASFGVVQYAFGSSAEALIARADRLMYEAKRLGRNRVVAAPWVPKSRSAEQLPLEIELKRVLDDGDRPVSSPVERFDQNS